VISTHYAYLAFFALMLIGLYVVISHGNLVKKLIGLTLLQVGVFLFYVGLGKKEGGSAPIVSDGVETYSHPLPQVLILTAIVVGVATLAVGLALSVRIFEAYGTVEEDEIVKVDHTAVGDEELVRGATGGSSEDTNLPETAAGTDPAGPPHAGSGAPDSGNGTPDSGTAPDPPRPHAPGTPRTEPPAGPDGDGGRP
jgi:multicomponent Na+:H+ antiporter subunit C